MIQDYSSPRQDDQFKEFFGVLRRRKGFVLAGVVLCAALGVLSVALSPASYQVNERILLSNYSSGNFNISTNPVARVSSVGVAPDIGAQIGLMQSPQIITQALADANVNIPQGAELSGSVVTIEQENTTPILSVQVNLPDKDSALRLAQAVPAAYNAYMAQTNNARVGEAVNSLQSKLNASRAALRKVQSDYEAYLADQGITVAANGSEGAERTQRLNGFESQLETARVSLSSAESAYRESLLAQQAVPKYIKNTVISPSNERIAAAEANVAELQGQYNSLRTSLADAHPDVLAVKAKLDQAKFYLKGLPSKTDATSLIRNPERATYDQRVSLAKQSFESAKAEVAKLAGLVARERAGLDTYQKRLPRQRQLETDLEEKRAQTSALSQRVAELNQLSSSSQPAVQVLQISDAARTQPVVGRALIASTLLGLILGVVAALLRDRFDNRVHTLEQLHDASGMIPIGEVPVSGRPLALDTGKGRNRTLESYRSLRFNIESAGSTEPVQSVLVASASAGEGRAALSMNLASEAATDMKKTILVDADMRNPELHQRFKLQRGPGLSDVLTGKVALQDALQKTSQENLLLLSAGEEHANPLELLSGPSFESTHEALKEIADVIVLNSPSMMRYTDGRAIAKVTDSVVFVAKRGFTRRDAMRYCIGMLRRAKTHLLGVVLVDERGRPTDVPGYATE